MNQERKSPNILVPGLIILVLVGIFYFYGSEIKSLIASFTIQDYISNQVSTSEPPQISNPGVDVPTLTAFPDVAYQTPVAVDAVIYPPNSAPTEVPILALPATATPSGTGNFPPNGANISLDDLLFYLNAVGQDTAFVACSPDAINGSILGWPNAVPVQMNVNIYLVDFTPIQAHIYAPNLCQWRTENGKGINGMNLYMTSVVDVAPRDWPWITYNGWLFTPFN